jgi:hypothetical protein
MRPFSTQISSSANSIAHNVQEALNTYPTFRSAFLSFTMGSPTDEVSRMVSPETSASSSPPGSNNSAVTSAPLGDSTVAPSTMGEPLATTTIAPDPASASGTSMSASAIADSDSHATNPPVHTDMSAVRDTLKPPPSSEQPTDNLALQEPPYLQINLRVPCAKHNANLADAGSSYIPFSYIYTSSTGVVSEYQRTLRSMIMEILHAPMFKFSYVAVDSLVDDLRSNAFFGSFQLLTGRNLLLPNNVALEAYFQRTQAYFDLPRDAPEDLRIVLNVDIPDDLIVSCCNYADSPYFSIVQLLQGDRKQPARTTTTASTHSVLTGPSTTITPPTTDTNLQSSSTTVSPIATVTSHPSKTLPLLRTPTLSPATTKSLDYSHCSDATDTDDMPIGQLLVSSLRKVSLASYQGITSGPTPFNTTFDVVSSISTTVSIHPCVQRQRLRLHHHPSTQSPSILWPRNRNHIRHQRSHFIRHLPLSTFLLATPLIPCHHSLVPPHPPLLPILFMLPLFHRLMVRPHMRRIPIKVVDPLGAIGRFLRLDIRRLHSSRPLTSHRHILLVTPRIGMIRLITILVALHMVHPSTMGLIHTCHRALDRRAT